MAFFDLVPDWGTPKTAGGCSHFAPLNVLREMCKAHPKASQPSPKDTKANLSDKRVFGDWL